MKSVTAIMIAVCLQFGALTFTATQAQASESEMCKVVTNDIGTILGKGRSPSSAFEDAAAQCFERRTKLYHMKKGTDVDEESGMVMIDMCANIRCGSNG